MSQKFDSSSTPTISVIMPVYNTGNILNDTVNSILTQTFKNFELILIDDGSTDNSGNLCDQFASKDSRIVVIHKKNGGICDARNVGLNAAKGEYIAFCDHDDIYKELYLDKMFSAAETSKADVVKCCYSSVIIEEDNVKSQVDHVYENNYLDSVSLREHYLSLKINNLYGVIWNSLYKKKCILDNHIFFDTLYRYGQEDMDFSDRLIFFVKDIAIISDILYVHYVRHGYSTSSQYKLEVLDSLCNKIVKLNDNCKKLNIPINKLSNDYVFLFMFYLVTAVSYSYGLNVNREYISNFVFEKFMNEKYKLWPANFSFFSFLLSKHGGFKIRFIYLIFYCFLGKRSINLMINVIGIFKKVR